MNKKIVGTVIAGVLIATPTALSQMGRAADMPGLTSLSLHDIMMRRSPGSRPDGALYSSKPTPNIIEVATGGGSGGGGSGGGFVPFSPLDGGSVGLYGDLFGGEVLPDFAPNTPGLITPGLPGSSSGGFNGGGGFSGGGFGGGGIGGGGGIVPITPVTPITPAVPEPSTWAMMIIGFGAVGLALRRRNKAFLVPSA